MNELLHAHQIAVMKAGMAGDDPSRLGHLKNVSHYAERIRIHRTNWQKELPFAPISLVRALVRGEGSQLRPGARSKKNSMALDSWETEGGALEPNQSRLPAGVITSFVRQYRVGPYVYSDLSFALAECERQKRILVGPGNIASPDAPAREFGDRR